MLRSSARTRDGRGKTLAMVATLAAARTTEAGASTTMAFSARRQTANVGTRVAGIVEAVRETFGQHLRLGFALQVAHAVAADDAANKGNPSNDLFGDPGVRGGGDIDRPSAGRDIGRVGEQFFIERQNVRLDVGFLGETALEIGAAAQHPQADFEQPPRRVRRSASRSRAACPRAPACRRDRGSAAGAARPRADRKSREAIGRGKMVMRALSASGCRNPSRDAGCVA